MGSTGSPTRGCNCQRGVCVIQEAGLDYKNDEKKDSLPDPWTFFFFFHPPGLSLVPFQHIKRCFVYWVQELQIRAALLYSFSHQVDSRRKWCLKRELSDL